MMEHTLHVERKVIGNTRTVEVAGQPLGENQVRLSVDRFAVTANNITYAVFGDLLSYWNFSRRAAVRSGASDGLGRSCRVEQP
jgi:hypothetical protein